MRCYGLVLCGLALGLSLSAPAAQAVESLKATLSTNRILVDGEEVHLTAYNINGNNCIMLRDIGRAVGFNVYWDSNTKCVQVESKKPYTGEAPVTSAEAKPVEQPAQTDGKKEGAPLNLEAGVYGEDIGKEWQDEHKSN